MTVFLQRAADGTDAPVHHVRGRDHVGTGFGVGQRLALQRLDGDVVDHIAGVVDDPVLPVGGEGVQGGIRDQAQLRNRLFHRAHRPLSQAVGIPGLFGPRGLFLRRRNREQGQGGNTQLVPAAGFAYQKVDG